MKLFEIKKTMSSRGAVDTSTVLSPARVSSIVEVTVEKHDLLLELRALELQRPGAPGAPVKTTLHKCCDPTTRSKS